MANAVALQVLSEPSTATPHGVIVAASAIPPPPAPPLAVDLTAGTIAGVAQLAVGHPFDTIKVKLQGMPAALPGQSPMYTSALDAVRKTIAADGAAGLYAGVLAPLSFVAVFNAILFAANSTMRSLVASDPSGGTRHVDSLSMAELGACGVGAGFAVSWVACPTELVKCRLQSGGAYAGPLDCAKQVYGARGVQGLYKGMAPTLAREMPANALYFGTYEATKRAIANATGKKSTDELASPALMFSGGMAGLGFWSTVYPIDSVKTRIQTDSDTMPRYRGMLDCATKTIRAEGLSALYRGIGPCLARAFPANAVTFMVFESVRGKMT
jgi:solute carrier family 25 (mitochondrial carnitine/acylcarnitine transporter), member 20/29